MNLDVTTQAHLAAGALALGLGIAALWRGPSRSRSRLFGGLALALAAWNLGAALRHAHAPGREAWRMLAYVGGAAAGPLAYHLALALSGALGRRRVRLALAYAAAACGLLATALLRGQPGWTRLLALGIPLTAAFLMAAHELLRGGVAREPSDRRSLRVLLALGAAATVIGLTDFLPRGPGSVPPLGALALVPFLFALANVGLHRRYLELDTVLARVAALALCAAAAGGLIQAAVALLGAQPLAYFLAGLVVVAASAPLVAAVLTGTRALLSGKRAQAAAAVEKASRDLAQAPGAAEAGRTLQDLSARLPGRPRLRLLLHEPAQETGPELAAMLARERQPVTRRLLSLDAAESRDPAQREAARGALAAMDRLQAEVAVPLHGEGRLVGVVTLGGGEPEAYLHGAAGSALVALGHQAVATLQRIEAQEAARRSEALALAGEMAASLAHDVRNPLGAIRGAASVLRKPRDVEQAAEMLAVIESESERLGRVLGDFLQWARPRPAHRVVADAAALARSLAARMTLAASRPPVDVESQGTALVSADPELLERALGNLVLNAREAAGPQGRVRVEVRRDDDGRVRLRVEDDGPGIPESIRPRLFDAFVTSKPGGTGLGLPLVQRVAAEHGGVVLVEDLRPRGTAFTLVLPGVPNGHDAGP